MTVVSSHKSISGRITEKALQGEFVMPVAMISLALGLASVAAVVTSIITAPEGLGLLGAGLALVMLTIAVADWRHFQIPDSLTLTGLILGFAYAVVEHRHAMAEAFIMATLRGGVLALSFLAVRQAYAYIRGRQGLGMGDVKLAAVAGVWLDWLMLPVVVEIAAIAGISIYILRQWILRRPVNTTGRIPFGLFFAPAIWICWLLEMRLVPA